MIEFHRNKGADLTIGVMNVPIDETHRFGLMTANKNMRILEFHEKPKEKDKGTLASMGIYVFNADALIRRLCEGDEEHPRLVFGKDVIPSMISEDRVYAYPFDGYWVDVGTIQSYWETNLALTGRDMPLDLYSTDWVIHTRSEERPPAKIGPQAQVISSMVSNGCVVRGFVSRSVLSPGVYISPGAVVRESVIL